MPQIPPIQFEGFNSGIPWAILTSKSPGYPYNKEGTRQSDTPDKWRYGVALPGNRYTPLTISIEGSTDFLRACLKSFDKNGGVGDNRKKQAGAGENASIPK